MIVMQMSRGLAWSQGVDAPLRPSPVILARQPDFRLGAFGVNPSSLEVTRGGWSDSLEPRVMQVLVALYQAHGAVMSREDLIARCWGGRIVGDDAINRAIGRLRKLAKSDQGASFVIETVPRVGYRLRPSGQAAPRAGWRQATIAFLYKFLEG